MNHKQTKIYKQPFLRREWQVIKAGLFERFLFKITFGMFGRLEYITLKETEMYRYFAGYSEFHVSIPNFSNENKPPQQLINCKCSMVYL